MADVKRFFIPNDEIELEAEFFQGESAKQRAVLVCHPHPQFGGSMHNNVVSAVFNACRDEDIPCVRFNFRAVGRSGGSHGNGKEERTDVKACVDYLREELGYTSLLIVGYSYGAAVACSVVNYCDEIVGYVAISFPWDFMGRDFKEKARTKKPKLFIQGTRDTIARYDKFESHYGSYEEPKEKIFVRGADHFYRGHESKVAKEVLKFYRSFD